MSEPSGTATFRASAEAYDRHVGRYGAQLARALCDAAGVQPGERALDVGCGPGALAAELVRRLGAENVAAVDPSPSFADACRRRATRRAPAPPRRHERTVPADGARLDRDRPRRLRPRLGAPRCGSPNA